MKLMLTVMLICITMSGFGQGRVDGYYKGKGNLDAVLSAGYESNPNYFAGTNKIGLSRDIVIGNAFLAYGIGHHFDVNVALPFIAVNGKEKGIQDLSVFLKYQVLEWSKSNFKLNLSIAGGFASNLTNYQTEGGNAIGQQAKVIDLRPVVHMTLPKGVFITLQSGYNFKSDPTPNALPFAAKIGMASGQYYFDLWYDYQHSFGGLDYQGSPSPSTFKSLGVDYHKIGGTFYKPIKSKFGVFGGLSYTITGRNTAQGFGVNAGIVYKYYKKK